MLNLGCFACPAKRCHAAQYRDSKCIELRSRLGEDDPGASTPYNLLYDEVLCTEVNWEQQLFRFKFNGKEVIYKQPHYVDASADTDHIRCVISMFLDEYKNRLLQKAKGMEREREDAEAILRIFPFADRNTSVWRENDGSLRIGVYGCWDAKVKPTLFPSLPAGGTTTLGAICGSQIETGNTTPQNQPELYLVAKKDGGGITSVGFQDIKAGDVVFLKDGTTREIAEDAHLSQDSTYDSYLCYDANGNSIFPDDLKASDQKYVIIREAFFADSQESEVSVVNGIYNDYDAALAVCEQLCKEECEELNRAADEDEPDEDSSNFCTEEELDSLPDGFRWDEDLLDESGEGEQKYDAVVRLWTGDECALVTGYMIRPLDSCDQS